jgi:ubiquinone biosynthesis protein Coq4
MTNCSFIICFHQVSHFPKKLLSEIEFQNFKLIQMSIVFGVIIIQNGIKSVLKLKLHSYQKSKFILNLKLL